METRLKIFFNFLLLSLIVQSCEHRPSSLKEYAAYIADPKNGLSKEKKVLDVKISVKFLPPSYLAFREAGAGREFLKDSLFSLYKDGMAFLITISPIVNTRGNDIMYRGIHDFQEFKQRAYLMNFKINEYISMQGVDSKFFPLLHNMENTYSLENNRKIYVVFSKADISEILKKEKTIDLVFDDVIFETGINHFQFEKENIEKALSI